MTDSVLKKQKRASQKEKECRMHKNATNMKNGGGKRILLREDRIAEVGRRSK